MSTRASESNGSRHLALHYPASLPGHAFGFNGAGLALSMNAVFPRAVDTRGAGGYFITRAALDAPDVDALVEMRAERAKNFGGKFR